jgi:hypothetical protein
MAESSDNWFVKLFNRFVFWTLHAAIENWRRRHGSHMRAWLSSVGDFEALAPCKLCLAGCFATLGTDAPPGCNRTYTSSRPRTAIPNDACRQGTRSSSSAVLTWPGKARCCEPSA